MAESIKYKNYFRIDESFKPAINLDTIEKLLKTFEEAIKEIYEGER